MALTSTLQQPELAIGNVRAKVFSATSSGGAGGDITTGMSRVLFACSSDPSATISWSAGTVTVTTSANETIYVLVLGSI